MNRLTEKISNEILVKNKNGNGSRSICYGCDGISNCTTRVCNFYRAMEKLATYEDLEEQGLLIKLPCKVGTPVYEICTDAGWHRVDELIKYHIEKVKFNFEHIDEIGKTVFLTREEAEKALEEQ
jgi:hypothetical protein